MTVIRKDQIPKKHLSLYFRWLSRRYMAELLPIRRRNLSNQSINRWIIHWFTRHFRNSERKDTISIISEIILILHFAYFDNNNEKNINHIVLDKK